MSARADYQLLPPVAELLGEVQRRLPAGSRLIQEAFSSEHRHPVFVKLSAMTADTFYLFDEITAQAFAGAVVELAARPGGGRLTISYPSNGEFRAQLHRLQRLAHKLERIRVLVQEPGLRPSGTARGLEVHSIAGNPLCQYRFALVEAARPRLFICRDLMPSQVAAPRRNLGFFTFDAEIVGDLADDIDQLRHGVGTQLAAFQRLEILHQTTQRVTRELESYARRMDLAIRRARRRPDLLTPARFDRIVRQAIRKMEELKEIPRRALGTIHKSGK